MANWYSTTFETNDKDIAEIIKNGVTTDFSYDEASGCGGCFLQYGIGSIDVERAAETAIEHKSSFHIISCDIMQDTKQTWVFENGVEVVVKTEHDLIDWDAILSDDCEV